MQYLHVSICPDTSTIPQNGGGALTTKMLSWGRDAKELSLADCGTLTPVELISLEELGDTSSHLTAVARRIIIAWMKEWCKVLRKTILCKGFHVSNSEKDQYLLKILYPSA